MRWILPALALLALALSSARPGDAQDAGWTLVSSYNDDIVSDIVMFDYEFGLAQSGYGVLRTLDGGRTWTEPPSAPLIGRGVIGFADRDRAWIAGVSGIWRTDDAGLNWRRQADGAGAFSTSIAVASREEAWITGVSDDASDIPSFTYSRTKLLHTTDGGTTWVQVELPGAGRYLWVRFVGRDGWVAASPCHPGETSQTNVQAPLCPDTTMLFHTGDGGGTWSVITREPASSTVLRRVQFVDASHGFGVGAKCAFCPQHLYVSADGGATWQERSDETEAVSFQSPLSGWSVRQRCFGGCAELSRTGDAGLTWTSPVPVPADPAPSRVFARIAVVTSDSVLMPGGVTGIRRYDLNSGAWSSAATDIHDAFRTMFFETRDRGYATAAGTLWITEDGGATWSPRLDPPSLTDFVAADGVLWSAVGTGCRGSCTHIIYRSDDLGESWRAMAVPSAKASGIQAADADHVWYYGEDGLWRTRDGGFHWTRIDSDPAASTRGYRFIGADHGWRGVCAAHGCTSASLALTSDGGDTWEPIPPPQGVVVTQVFTPLRAFGFRTSWPACPCDDVMVSTSDGGLTWSDVGIAEFSLAFLSVVFFDDGHGVALGYREERSVPDTFFDTQDGGGSWQPHELPPMRPLGEFLARDGRVWFLTGLSPSPFPNDDRQFIYRRDVFDEASLSPPSTPVDPDAGTPSDGAPLVAGLVAALAAAAAIACVALLLRFRRLRA